LRDLLPYEVVAAMVPYGVNEVSPGHFRRSTYGSLAFEDTVPQELLDALETSGLRTETYSPEDIKAVLWGKLIINLQNAPNALVGRPLSECIPNRAYRQVMTAAWLEGLRASDAAGITINAKLNGKPLETVIKAMRMPSFIYAIVVRTLKPPDAAYRSSMWTDLDQKRSPEIQDLNGTIVDLAAAHGTKAPVNALLLRLVTEAHEAQRGSPNMPIEELLEVVARECPGSVELTESPWPSLAAAATFVTAAVLVLANVRARAQLRR